MEKYIFKEEEVIIKGQYNIVGTLATPERYEEKSPAVLIIPGSGQIDRDGYVENMKFATNLYKDFQADQEKLQRLPELVKGELEYHVIKDMNHGLKKHEGPMSALNFKKEYKEKANEPLRLEVVDMLSSWLKKYY